MTRNTLIDLQNVSKRYAGSSFVLQDMTLQVQESEFVAIVGPSGGGKTTMLNLIATLSTGDEIEHFDVSVYRVRQWKQRGCPHLRESPYVAPRIQKWLEEEDLC